MVLWCRSFWCFEFHTWWPTGLVLFYVTLYHWHQHVKDRWICEIIDVKAAFLEGKDMHESICIEWPDGILDDGFESIYTIKNTCILLEKAMYGMVRAALQFFKKLVENFTLIGFEQSKVNPCMSVRGVCDHFCDVNFLFVWRTSTLLLNGWKYVYSKLSNGLIKIP